MLRPRTAPRWGIAASVGAAAVLAASACTADPTGTVGAIEQRFLFEIESVNYAWGLHWAGLYIDREGRIVAYDHSHAPWAPTEEGSYDEAELLAKYQHETRVVGQVDTEALWRAFDMIARVREEWSEPRSVCRDAGGLDYVAFRYDAALGRYRPILLRREGDWVSQNTSSAGEWLARWLRQLLTETEDPGVAPFPDGVCTP